MMVKLLQFGFILLVAFFCVSVPSASAAPIKSVTGCGWKTDLTAVGFNLLSQIDDRFDQFAIRIKCQKTCTELELEFNNGGINSLEVCFKGKYIPLQQFYYYNYIMQPWYMQISFVPCWAASNFALYI